MKVRSLLLAAVLVAAVNSQAFAADQPKAPGAPGTPGSEAPAPKKKFVIRLTNGGTIETDNYFIEGGKVRMNLPSVGAISIDRSMVKSITEEPAEGPTVQESMKPAAPSMPRKAPEGRQGRPVPEERPQPLSQVQTDNDGHTEAWWKKQVSHWKKKLADAQMRYQKAQADWNQYNGVLQNLGPSTAQYDVTKYQDMRGAARVQMDQAQADLDEAKHMLDQGLPDEARKAGAPPGWAR